MHNKVDPWLGITAQRSGEATYINGLQQFGINPIFVLSPLIKWDGKQTPWWGPHTTRVEPHPWLGDLWTGRMANNITDGFCKVSNGRHSITLIFYMWPTQNWGHTPAKKNDKVYPTFIKVGPKAGPHHLWLDGKINITMAPRKVSKVGINDHCFLQCGPPEVCIYLIMRGHGPKIIWKK